MLQTLFYIPSEIAGYPVFGFGLLLGAWAVFSVGLLAWLGWRHGFHADTWGYLPLLVVIAAAIVWLLPVLSVPMKGLPIRGYGVMLLVAVVAGTLLMERRGRSMGVHPDQVISLVFWMFLPGIIGARIFYVIEYWPKFHQATAGQTLFDVLNVAKGGLVVYGSLIGGLLGVIVFSVKQRISLWVLGDLVTPSVALGMALGRIGCLLNGCCYGSHCDLPWAVTFPWNSPPHEHQVRAGQTFVHGLKFVGGPDSPAVIAEVQPASAAARAGLKPGQQITVINSQTVHTVDDAERFLLFCGEAGSEVSITVHGDRYPKQWVITAPLPRSLPVHPTQLYGVLDGLTLCLLLLAYAPFRRRDGELLALLMTLYPVTRFLQEMIRTDEAPVFGTGMTISQNVSLLMLIAAIGVWCYLLAFRPRRASGADPAA